MEQRLLDQITTLQKRRDRQYENLTDKLEGLLSNDSGAGGGGCDDTAPRQYEYKG
jgi:hypothetical protein